MNIHIGAKIKECEIESFIKVWNQNDNISLEVDVMSEDEIRNLFSLLIPFLPCEFCEIILGELCEMNETPSDLLEEIIKIPMNTNACMFSICLRDNLNDFLSNKCVNSDDELIREHYLQRQSCRDKEKNFLKIN
jgi:hypothetical protein